MSPSAGEASCHRTFENKGPMFHIYADSLSEGAMTTSDEFYDRYSTLAGFLAGYFYSSSGKAEQQIALDMLDESQQDPKDRPALLRELVADTKRLISNIHSDWSVFAEVSNRPVHDSEAARAWLMGVLTVWENELKKTG